LIHPLIIGNLKNDPLRVLKSGLVVAIEISFLLTQIAIAKAILPDDRGPTLIAHWISNLLGIVFWISFGIAALMKYVDVMERNCDFGILRILGASDTYIVALLMQETIIESVPGIFLGLVFCFIGIWLFEAITRVSVSIPYEWWPLVIIIAIYASLVGAIFAFPKAIREGIAQAL
jgi:hypothetical protein